MTLEEKLADVLRKKPPSELIIDGEPFKVDTDRLNRAISWHKNLKVDEMFLNRLPQTIRTPYPVTTQYLST